MKQLSKQKILLFSVCIIFLAGCDTLPGRLPISGSEKKTDSIMVRVYGNNHKGYGYRIIVDGNDTVDQPFIPAVQRNKTFITSEDALRTALLVKQKMEMKIFPPVVTIAELDSLEIRY